MEENICTISVNRIPSAFFHIRPLAFHMLHICCEKCEECNKWKWPSLCYLRLRRTHGELSVRKMESICSVHSLMLLKINWHILMPRKFINYE